MSTNNFHYVNTSKCYAVLMNDYDNPEDFDCDSELDDLLSNLEIDLDEKFKHNFEVLTKHQNYNDPHELRSYPSRVFGCVSRAKYYADMWVEIDIYLVIRSGYFDGAALDWWAEFKVDGYKVDDLDVDRFCNYFSDSRRMNEGMIKIQAQNAVSWLESQREEIVDGIENIYSDNSTNLCYRGSMSNGEAVYTRC